MSNVDEPLVFMDECGYTGQDLLDKAQPFFVLATLRTTEAEASAWKREFFGKVQAQELKHAALGRRPRGQRAVAAFLQGVALEKKVKIEAVHKRYALVMKMVDLIVETSMHNAGYDLYARGGNIAFSNVLYCMLHVEGWSGFGEAVLQAFQHFVREPTPQSYAHFQNQLSPALTLPEPVEEFVDMVRVAAKTLTPTGACGGGTFGVGPLELMYPMAVKLAARWRAALGAGTPFVLAHDESGPMAKVRALWDAVVDPSAPPATVGYDRRLTTYPIAVSETRAASSLTSSGLQLVDVVAGATERALDWWRTGKDPADSYAATIATLIENLEVDGMLPSTEVRPEALGTVGEDSQDALDYTTRLFNARFRIHSTSDDEGGE